MPIYIINKNPQKTGEHEVHNLNNCSTAHLPALENRVRLGEFKNCANAINFARNELPNLDIDGC